MELQAEKLYNCGMQVKLILPAIELEPLPGELDIADFCLQLRTQLGISKKEMAQLLNIQYTSYDNYEHGRREPTSQVTAKLFLLKDRMANIAPLIAPQIQEKKKTA